MSVKECLTEFSYNMLKHSYAGDMEITLPYHVFVLLYLDIASLMRPPSKAIPASLRLYGPTGIMTIKRGNP